ncbi:MAG: hypothetical protein HY222_07495 [Thaumarchaeota archaeon]|nr:hypothetical protein [Nitrososphaerota archaeon]MBI3642219.1 hypothetical protein [Nitrososphaerota archaeon]
MVKSRVFTKEDCSGIREETYLDQKMNSIEEEFASFVRIKEVFLDEDGLERSLLLSRRWIL